MLISISMGLPEPAGKLEPGRLRARRVPHNQVGPLEILFAVLAQRVSTCRPSASRASIGSLHLVGGAQVGDAHTRPVARHEARHPQPAPMHAQAHDEDIS